MNITLLVPVEMTSEPMVVLGGTQLELEEMKPSVMAIKSILVTTQ